METVDLETWREVRGSGWFKDYGYELQDVLRHHRYDYNRKGAKPDDPGWHACTCGWEGYWSGFEPHVADHLRAVVAVRLTQSWDDGYNDAATMARCYGHTDHWENEPSNPYRAARQDGHHE